MNKDFITAVEEIEREKGISKEILFEAIESALVSAYKKNYGTSENVLVNIDRLTGDIGVFMVRQVAEEVTLPCLPLADNPILCRSHPSCRRNSPYDLL